MRGAIRFSPGAYILLRSGGRGLCSQKCREGRKGQGDGKFRGAARNALWAATRGLAVAREVECLWRHKFKALSLLGDEAALETSIRQLDELLLELGSSMDEETEQVLRLLSQAWSANPAVRKQTKERSSSRRTCTGRRLTNAGFRFQWVYMLVAGLFGVVGVGGSGWCCGRDRAVIRVRDRWCGD